MLLAKMENHGCLWPHVLIANYLPSIFSSIGVFSNESVLCIRWSKSWSFSFIISPSNEYSGLISSTTGKDWRQEKKKTTEDKMVGWHHQLDGHEFEQAPGVSDGQGSLVCCSPWGCKESDTTEWLNFVALNLVDPRGPWAMFLICPCFSLGK